jgi:phenazine biosynthesis protein phzE
MLAPFWLSSQVPDPVPALAGRTAVVVDAEDRFTTMLAHQLRHLGMAVTVLPWTEVAPDGSVPVPAGADRLDLVVSGPGPGDPRADGDPRVERLRAVVRRRLAAHEPLVAVCLSHQVLCHELGLPLERLDRPRQGVQLTVDLFGEPVRLGFYNTYTARLPLVTPLPDGVTAAADPSTGDVFALRGPGFATIQGHAESILSVDGLTALERLATHALAPRAS